MAINLKVNFTARGNFGQLASALNSLGANIAQSQKNIAGAAAAASRSMKGTEQATLGATAAAQSFKTAQVQMLTPMNQLSTAMRKGDVTMRQLGQTWGNLGRVAAQQQSIQTATIQSMRQLDNGMMTGTLRMGEASAATVGFTQRLGVAAAAAAGFSRSMINLGKNIQWGGRQITVGLSVPLGFAAFAAHKAASEIEGELVRLEKVYTTTSDNASFELEVLRDQMMKTAETSARAFGATSAETLNVAADFASMGYTIQNGLAGMVTETQRMQQLGEMELPDAINLVRSVQAAWQLDTEELIDTMNRLNAVENRTPLLLRDIATAMPEVAAVANQMGISTTFAAAGMAAMREGGLDAGESAMAMRQLIVRMVDPTETAKQRFDELGISLDKLFEGTQNGEEMILRLSEALGQLAPEEQIGALSKLVSVRQAARVQILMQAMQDSADGVQNSWSRAFAIIGEDAETLAEDAAHEAQRWRESAVGQAAILKAQFNNELADLGEPLMDVFNTFRRWALAAVSWFNDLGAGIKRAILVGLGITAIMGPLIMLSGVLINAAASVGWLISRMVQAATRTKIMTEEQRFMEQMMKKGWLTAEGEARAMDTLARSTDRAAKSTRSLVEAKRHGGVASVNLMPEVPAPMGRGARAARIGGAIGGLSAVAGIASAFVKADSVAGQLLSKITQLGMAAALIAPAISMILPAAVPLVPLLAAMAASVVAVGAGIALWRRHLNNVEAGFESAGGAAEKMAKAAGIAWQDVNNLVSEEGIQNVQDFADANAEAIAQLKTLANISDARAESYVYQIAWEMKRHGATDDEIKYQIQRLADEAGTDIYLGVVLDFNESNMRAQIDEYVSDIERTQGTGSGLSDWARSFWNDLTSLEEADTYGLTQQTQAIATDMQRILADTLRTGEPDLFANSLDQMRESIGNLNVESKERAAIEALVAQRAAEQMGINIENIKSIRTLSDLQDELIDGNNNLARHMEETLRLQRALERARAEGDPQRIANAEARYADALERSKRKSAEAAAEAAGLSDNLDDVAGSFADAEKYADGYYNALRSEMGGRIKEITNLYMEQLDRRHDREMDAWDARSERMDEAHERERDAIEETHKAEMESVAARYDARIEALEKTLDTEKELDRLREYAFAREKRRRDWEEGRAQSSIDLQAAIARGDLDEAARIRQGQASSEYQYRQEEIKAVREFEAENRRRAVDMEIEEIERAKEAEMDRLEAEQDIAKERLKTEQELQKKRLEVQKDSLRESQRIEKRRAQQVAREAQNITAATQAEYEVQLRGIERQMTEFGGNLSEVASEYYSIFKSPIFKAFEDAQTAATNSMAESAKWENAGREVGEAIERGLMGRGYTQAAIRNYGLSATRPLPAGIERHSGGPIGRLSAKAPGLDKDEVPAVLQSGEYVIQRDAVKKLGRRFLDSLNAYHGGGLIDTIDRWAPARAMGNVLGQVLGGVPLEEAGSTGAAIHRGLMNDQPNPLLGDINYQRGYADLQAPDRDATWRESSWKVGMDNAVVRKVAGVLAAIPGGQAITSALRRGAVVQGTNRTSLHARGKAVDIHALARSMGGTLASERMGDQIAAAFRKTPGIKEVLWKTWTGGNHFDHVHAGFYHQGGLAIPSLAKGAHVNYDNVMANLHRGETVLTSSLSDQLQQGIAQFANGGGNRYDVTVKIEGDVNESNAKRLAREIRREIEQLENRSGPNRRVG